MKKHLLSVLAAGTIILCTAGGALGQWSVTNGLNTSDVTTGGKVGIGIAPPVENLDVNSSSDAYIRVARVGLGTAGYKIGNTTVMSVHNHGNYGGGTLNINNTGMINLTGSQITFGDLPGAGYIAGKYNFSGRLWANEIVASPYSPPGQSPWSPPSGFSFVVNGNSYMKGSLGIGTVSIPHAGLHVKQNNATGTNICIDATNTAGGANWLFQSTGGTNSTGQGNLLIAKEGAKQTMTLSPNGYVRIGSDLIPMGTSQPPYPVTALLELKRNENTIGAKNVMLKLSNTYNGNAQAHNEPTILFDNGTTNSTYGEGGFTISAQVAANHDATGTHVSDGTFRIGSYQNGVQKEHLKITHDGKVAIGINGPLGNNCVPADGRLFVNGKIYANAIQVKLTNAAGCFPDYVFAADYKLRSLEEVEKYVIENSHLPEVPSAKEVEEKGIDVAEMDAILLKKIEELTLYTIEMNKKMADVQKENDALKQRINNLENK